MKNTFDYDRWNNKMLNLQNSSDNLHDLFVDLWESGINIDIMSQKIHERIKEMEQVSNDVHDAKNQIEEVLQSVQNIHKLSLQSQEKTQERQASFLNWDIAFKSINKKFNLSQENSKQLKKSINEINQFTKIIERITQEVNLLSLNASIESARAGNEGVGFSVVAQEVKKMSHRATRVNQDIHRLVNEIWDKTEALIEEIQDVSNTFQKTIEKNQEIQFFLESLRIKTHATEIKLEDFYKKHNILQDEIISLESLIQIIVRFTIEFKDILQFLKELSEKQHQAFSHHILHSKEKIKESFMPILKQIQQNHLPSVYTIRSLKKNWNFLNRAHHEVWQKAGKNTNFVETIKQAGIDVDKTVESIGHVQVHIHHLVEDSKKIRESWEETKETNLQIQNYLQEFIKINIENNKNLNHVNQSSLTLSKKIHEVKTLIVELKNISEQIDFLSLHASIEAAHVQKKDTGFHQVSLEIQKLADDSRASTQNTRKIIENIEQQIQFFQSSIDDAENGSEQQIRENNIIDASLKNMIDNISKESKQFEYVLKKYYEITKKLKNIEKGTENIQLFVSDFGIVGDEIIGMAWFQLVRKIDYERIKVKIIDLIDELEDEINHIDKEKYKNEP